MHRDGTDPENVQLEDILCDFCGVAAWAIGNPCVEGHRGSVICGKCLTVAYVSIVSCEVDEQEESCVMCLEKRSTAMWKGLREEATVCRRCVKQSAGILQKSPEYEWSKPGA